MLYMLHVAGSRYAATTTQRHSARPQPAKQGEFSQARGPQARAPAGRGWSQPAPPAPRGPRRRHDSFYTREHTQHTRHKYKQEQERRREKRALRLLGGVDSSVVDDVDAGADAESSALTPASIDPSAAVDQRKAKGGNITAGVVIQPHHSPRQRSPTRKPSRPDEGDSSL